MIVFAPQLAAFISATIGVSAGVAAAIVKIATSLIISIASAMMAPKPKLNAATEGRLNLTVTPNTPRKIVFGRTAAGADVRFLEKTKKTYGSNQKDTSFQVVALASHPINAVKSLHLEDELSFNGSSAVGKYSTDSSFTCQPILEGSTANAAAFGSGAYWSSTASFLGCAYLKLTFKLDFEKVYADGVPSRITTTVEGCPIYDPRLDSTNGGLGAHRTANQATRAYYNLANEIGRNPALCLLQYLLGWKINGKIAWGMGIPPENIDFANFIVYANMCDESVALLGGGTVKRYQCDGIFSTDQNHESVLTAITASMGSAKLVDSGGLYKLVGGFDDTASPIFSFTQDDIIGPYQWNPSQPVRDRFNIARGQFTAPEDLFIPKDWGSIELDALPDGIPRVVQFDFNCVTRAETCQRIAKQKLLRNLKTGMFIGTYGPRAFGVEVGSLCYVSLPSEGWNNKLFRVIDQTESVDLMFQMTLQEESPAIYAWDREEKALPANIKVPNYNPQEVESVASLAATSRRIANTSGGYESYIDVAWTKPQLSARSIEIQSKESAGTVWSNASTAFDADAGGFTFRSNAGGLSTNVRARFRMFSGIFGPWSTVTVTAAVGGPSSSITGYLTDESVTFAADSAGNIL